jgi:hypothetical protein
MCTARIPEGESRDQWIPLRNSAAGWTSVSLTKPSPKSRRPSGLSTAIVAVGGSLSDLLAKKPGIEIGFQKDRSEIGNIARSLESYKGLQEERNRVTQQMQLLLEFTGQGIYGIERTAEFCCTRNLACPPRRVETTEA